MRSEGYWKCSTERFFFFPDRIWKESCAIIDQKPGQGEWAYA